MTRPACVVIDRQAARANLARVRKLVPHRKIMAIIKADAYGHGLLRMAEPLADADAFGVACLEEAQSFGRQGSSRRSCSWKGPSPKPNCLRSRNLGSKRSFTKKSKFA